jgi:hypothetical protein
LARVVPYYITKFHPDCSKWAVVKNDYSLVACHTTKKSATDQMVAMSVSEEIEPGGTHPRDERRTEAMRIKEVSQDLYVQLEGDEKALVDAMLGVVQEYGRFGSESSSVYVNYTPAAQNEDASIGVKCGNCVFHAMTEDGIVCNAVDADIEEDGVCRLSMIPPGLVNAPEAMNEADTYKVPDGVQSAAKRALKWISDGKAGDGFTDVGRRRASQLASGGSVSRDVVARMKSYLARHQSDKKAEGFYAGQEGYPSPGRVAYDAWGGDAGYTWTKGIKLD